MTTDPLTSEHSGSSDGNDSELESENPFSLALLESAWKRYDAFDQNATRAQQRFFFLRRLITYLSILVVVLAVVQPVILNQAIVGELEKLTGAGAGIKAEDLQALRKEINALSLRSLWSQSKYRALAITNFLLILFPIMMTGLRAFAVKFDRGSSWVLLRGSAEALKMEIFYYRTQVKPYHQNRNQILAEKIQLVSERVKGGPLHQTALSPYEGEAPKQLQLGLVLWLISRPILWLNRLVDRLWQVLFRMQEVPIAAQTAEPTEPSRSIETQTDQERYADLDVEGYLHQRLADQFDWYRVKAKVYNRRYQIFQTSVYIFGGLGTLLAATGLQNWVAVTAALAGAFVTYLEYRRIEATLVGYNQAADALYDIRAWWYSLSQTEKADPKNFEKLVINTEETIRSEHNSWLQDMQDRLANLYEGTSEKPTSTPEATPSDHAHGSGSKSEP